MKQNGPFGLLSTISDFLVCIDPQGRIKRASTTSHTFLQVSKELLQESIERFVQPEDLVLLTEARKNAKKSGEKQVFVCRLLRQSVLPVWVNCYLFYLPDDSFLIAAFDAMHWKENEDRLIYLSKIGRAHV